MSRIVNRILGGDDDDDDDDDDDEQNVVFLGDPPRLNATAVTPTEDGGEDNVVMIVSRATQPKDKAAELRRGEGGTYEGECDSA